MRICIYGAGAVGSFVAAKLGAGGAAVSIVARGPHLAAIQANGLKLVENAGETTVRLPASADPAELGPQDIVVVTTKAHSLASVAKAIGPLLEADTPVVFAQNGIPWWYGHGFSAPGFPGGPLARLDPDGAIWNGVGPERAIGCAINSPNAILAPGVVENRRAGKSNFVLGAASGAIPPVVNDFAAALESAGILAPISDDIRHDVWTKLLLNICNAPLCTLTQSDIVTVMRKPGLRQAGIALMREAIAVAAAHGVVLDADPEKLTDPATRPKHKPSILQDFEAGKPLEIDPILGCVADFATGAGIATPMLDVILPLMQVKANTAGLYQDTTA